TSALVQIAGYVQHDFNLLKSVIEVNNDQRRLLVKKAKERFGNIEGKRVAVLGLAFKPNTDDMREAASITLCEELIQSGAEVVAYDPIAIPNAKKILPQSIQYADSVENALENADFAFIVTEWDEVKNTELDVYIKKMKTPVIFDGRNCYALEEAAKYAVEYHSVGRKTQFGI